MALYRVGMSRGMQMTAGETATPAANTAPGAANVDPATGKRVLYWHDPMVPGQKFDKPGKSPFMDMQLVPVYADGDGDTGNVTISPRVQQNLGVRTAEVNDAARSRRSSRRSAASPSTSATWRSCRRASAVSSSGCMCARRSIPVRKGQPLVELYVPDWVAAQEEYLAVKRMQGQRDRSDGRRPRASACGSPA